MCCSAFQTFGRVTSLAWHSRTLRTGPCLPVWPPLLTSHHLLLPYRIISGPLNSPVSGASMPQGMWCLCPLATPPFTWPTPAYSQGAAPLCGLSRLPTNTYNASYVPCTLNTQQKMLLSYLASDKQTKLFCLFLEEPIKPRALHMLGEFSTTELQTQSHKVVFERNLMVNQ